MTKADLIEKVQATVKENTGQEISKRVVKEAMDSMLNEIANAVSAGDEILLQPLGRFHSKFRKARKATNMQTGDPIAIPAKFVPNFAATTKLKEATAELPVVAEA